jgi:heme-degrading monooxygenase HmoA
MIARTWRGVTRASDADRYADYVAATGLRAFSETAGNLGALLMRRPVDADGAAGTEFLVISFWESMEAVQRFAGPEPSRAVFYPEDDAFLVRRETTVDHFEIVVHQDGPTRPVG